jgi:hypothetical protein
MGLSPLPDALAERRDVLLATDRVLLDQHVPVRPHKWLEHIGHHPAAATVIDAHAERGFVRRDLADYAAAALASDTDHDWVAAFVVCQMWGSGTSNNRGLFQTASALDADPDGHILRDVAHHVVAGRQGEVYRLARSSRLLPGWGPSFATKFTYAVALHVDGDRPRALILDERVWDSLAALGWSSLEAAGTRRWTSRYGAYVNQAHQWATEVGCRPDSVEHLLWTAAGDL